jgi:peptide chain release factor 1
MLEKESDEELRELAREELNNLTAKTGPLEDKIRLLLLPTVRRFQKCYS